MCAQLRRNDKWISWHLRKPCYELKMELRHPPAVLVPNGWVLRDCSDRANSGQFWTSSYAATWDQAGSRVTETTFWQRMTWVEFVLACSSPTGSRTA